jgi:DNA topoisomerase-1
VANKKVKGLVIVESPAKAKKINSYLGDDYIVLASVGHVCDLPQGADQIPDDVKKAQPWTKLGVNVDNDFEPYYVVPKDKEKTVRELKAALKNAEELIIATDEDREGESIGWHIQRLLAPKVPVKRMVFSEITKAAIKEAIAHPRQIDENLVAAQETRRIVDRLYGYTLSPLLWKKVAPKLSAGRVQSVAVRVLVSRELERLAFKKGTYWDLKATLETADKTRFTADLAALGGRKIASGKDFDEHTGKLKVGSEVLLLDEKTARDLQTRLQTAQWLVSSLEHRQQVRRPYPPFTTSTLQQESSRKLGLSTRDTMAVAQRLYEDGYITYMRTDSVSLSSEAITASRGCVKDRYGDIYLSPEPRQFTTKSKGAQEAHEAIRPAGTEMKTADELGLSGREAKLYSLIWMRTVATQMAEARLQFVTAIINAADAEFRATGRHVEFPGFFRAYVEGVDDPEAALDDQEAALPPIKEQDKLGCQTVDSLSHETKPPARFTEATLVGKLESEGVGRPSTYASIISTIQDRNYAIKTGNQLIPTFTAMAVTKLLERHFPQLVDLAFTAKMEQTLDEIATGEAERLPYLRAFYSDPNGLENQVKTHEEEIDPRTACTLEFEGLEAKIRIGRFGAYAEKMNGEESLKASLPNDLTPADITNEIVEGLILRKQQGPQALGDHPETGVPIYVMTGPYGTYLQLGQVKEGEPKPKRVSVPKNIPIDALTFQTALDLINLPRTLGKHPETGKVVNAGVGMYGPYVLHDKKYKSIPKEQSVLTISMDEAVELLKQVKGRAVIAPLKELGNHPTDSQPIAIYEGRYGSYVKHGDNNATLPKDRLVEEVTLDEALILLAERAAKGPSKKKGRSAKKSVTSVAKKTSPKNEDGTEKAAAKKKAATKKKTAKSDATIASKDDGAAATSESKSSAPETKT